MSDFFEKEEQHDFFQLPERREDYRRDAPVNPDITLPENVEGYRQPARRGITDDEFTELMKGWNEDIREKKELKNNAAGNSGAEFSSLEYDALYKMRKKGILNDDDIYKLAFSKELGGYLGLDAASVYRNYDELWQIFSDDLENRYAIPKSRYEAIRDSIQIAKNMNPMGLMGVELQNLHSRVKFAVGKEKEDLQKRADELWVEINALKSANDELGKRMPKGALNTVLTSTIQSAPLTGKSILGGVAGGLISGGIGAIGGAVAGGVGAGPGFAAGWSLGYNLGGFLASTAEMTGLLYVDLLAAGVEQENASRLALVGGSINGFIETGLGIVAGWGKSAGKAIGGAVLSKEAQKKIAEAASKSFIKRISTNIATSKIGRNIVTRTLFDVTEKAGEEGFEEWLQFLVEHAMFALGDAMQDAPVDRNLWGSPEFMDEMKQSVMGGIAGGIGFGIVNLPFTVTGNVVDTARQTTHLKRLATVIDNEAEFRELAKNIPLVERLKDDEIRQIYDSQESERSKYNEEARVASELSKTTGLGEGYYEERKDQDTGEIIPLKDAKTGEVIPLGETYRKKSGLLYTELDEKRGIFKAGDPRVEGDNNLYSHIEYARDDDGTVRINKFSVRKDLDNAEFRHEFYNRFAETFAGAPDILWNTENMTNREVEIREELIKGNPYGTGLNYYPEKINIADEIVDTAAKGDTVEAARAKMSFGEQMAKFLPGSTEASRSGAVRLIDRIGRSYGLTFDKFLEKLKLDPNEIFTHEANEDVKKENVKRAAQYGKGNAVTGALQQMMKKLDADMKSVEYSVVYLDPNKANYSTVIHELKHAVDNFLKKYDPKLFDRMMAAAGEYDYKLNGKKEYTWEDEYEWRRERSAYAFEHYLETGEAPNPELKSLFQQMKEWLRDIIEYLFGMRALTPEQKEVFDELLSKADKVAAELDSAGQKQETASGNASAGPQTAQADGLQDVNLDDVGQRETTEKADETKEKDVQTKVKNSDIDTSGLAAWREQYAAAKKIYGDRDTVNINGVEIPGRYVMLEAEIPMASHDEITFLPTPGFPTVDGKNVNTRDYFHDKPAQEAVIKAGSDFDSRALDDIPMVTKDKAVPNGSNRTMSSKLAAKNNTDSKYLNSLPQKSKKFGFKSDDRLQFNHPRIYFEIEVEHYDAALFDMFNQSNKKATDPVETAVKMAKLIKDNTVKSIAAVIKEKESIDELYQDKKALQEIFNTLKTDKLIGEYDMPQYFTEQGGITGAGEDLLENVLLGATLKEDNIRVLSDVKGLRRKLARALPYLVDNKAMGEYSVIPEVNEAVRIAAEVEKNSKKWHNVEEWAAQADFDFLEQKNQIAVELAKQLVGKNQSGFADMIGGLNAVLTDAATGQADMFAAGVESKENIVRRYLGIKAEIAEIREANNKIINNKKAPMVERNAAAMDNAGLAKIEADSRTMFQLAYHGSPYLFDCFNSSYIGKGTGRQLYGHGHYAAGLREVAEWYRETLSGRKGLYQEIRNKKIFGRTMMEWHDYWEGNASDKNSADITAMLVDLFNSCDYNAVLKTAEEKGYSSEAVDWFKKTFEGEIQKPGLLYEVDIPGDDEMLDWDKPFGQQPAFIQELLKDKLRNITRLTGGEIYERLAGIMGSDRAVSKWLNKNGVKGNRFMDTTSLFTGENSYNYVIFDDNEINISRTLFQIIGEKGAQALDEAEKVNNRIDNLNIARQMEEEGKDAKAIRMATGWERGADKKWRYEIADIKINFSDPFERLSTGREEGPDGKWRDIVPEKIENWDDFYLVKEKVNLYRLVEGHPELFEAYPSLRNITVKFAWTLGFGGAYNPDSGTILLNLNNNDVKETLIHEIQHAIQHLEGHAEGSNIQYWKDWTENSKQIRQNDNRIRKLRTECENLFDGLSDEEKDIYREYNRSSAEISESRSAETLAELNDRTENKLSENGFSVDTFQKYRAGYEKIEEYRRYNGILEPYDLYKRTAGEVEARNAAYRYNPGRPWKRELLLADTEDVAREDQLFIENGKYAASYDQTFYQIKEDLTITDENLTQGQAYDAIKSLEHTDLINNEEGISAQINSDQRKKLISNAAVRKSVENGYTREQHYAAAAKIDKIWKHAVKIEDRADSSDDKNIKSIKRFVAPLRYSNETAYANLLVKESVEHGHRIYTVELQEINKLRSILDTLENERTPVRSLPVYQKIMQLAEKVNPSSNEETQTFLQTNDGPETDNFKQWFADSKITDENGNPQVLYHQTENDFDVFEPRRGGAGQFDNETPFGIFLKPNDNDIGLPGKKQMALYARIVNPLRVSDRNALRQYLEKNIEGYADLRSQYENVEQTLNFQSRLEALEIEFDKRFEKWEAEHPEAGVDTHEGLDKRQAAIDKIESEIGLDKIFPERREVENKLSAQMKELVDQHFRNSGYDGIILDSDEGGIGKKTTKTFIAFDPNQVKSTDNAGTFDRNNDSIFFQLDDELLEDAAQHDSWEEFRDSVEPGVASGADNAWYKSLWEDSKKIHKDTLFQDDEETGRGKELDNRFYKEADEKYLTNALKELIRIHEDQSLEPSKEESGAAWEDYRRVKRLQNRIETDTHAGSIIGMAAQVRSGRRLSSTQYTRLKTYIRKDLRYYRSFFADIMGQEEYLEDLAETKDGEPAGKLADPRPEKQDSKARLKEIASIIKKSDPELARGIEDGSISYEDPRIKAFEEGVNAEYKEAKEKIEKLEKETAEDYARLANDAQRRIVNAHEKMIKAREQMEAVDEVAQRRMNEEGKIAEPYLKKQKLEKASFEQALKAYHDLINVYGLDAQAREIIARHEALAAERARHKGVMMNQRAIRALRETKKKLIKRITRNVSFDNVAYDQAALVKAVQRIFINMAYHGINKWIGPEDRKVLREVWSQWSTDEEFRENLLEQIKNRKTKTSYAQAERVENILNKEWKDIRVNDKRALYTLLPGTDAARDLKLGQLDRENRESVQLDIDAEYVDGKGVVLVLGPELKRQIKENIGDELYNRMQNKPFTEWSLAEAEELGRTVDKLIVEGKNREAARKEARRTLDERYRAQVLEALENTGIVINDDDTPEEKEKKRNEQNRILKKFARGKKNNLWNSFFDANLRRFTTALDGGRKGIITNLMYWGENDAYNEEQRQVAARRLLVDTVMEENNITLDELYKEVEITGLINILDGSENEIDLYRNNGKVTVDDLLFMVRGYENEETRQAIMYGNLSNAKMRNYSNTSDKALEAFQNTAHGRMMSVMSCAREFFAKEENKKFLKLLDAIGADYDRNGERLNRACIDMFNKPMWRVEKYVPMNRQEVTGEENEHRVIEDLLGMTGVGDKWVERGFTVKREKIKPGGQRPIELGLYKTWAKSVSSTEHLLAYGPLVQRLNAVFKGYHAGEIKQAMRDRWGQAAVNRIGETIAEFANPDALSETAHRSGLNKIVRSLRGKTATAYLAWKTSGILKQLATSPWPYLQEIPVPQYLAACFEVAGGAGKVNDFIREKSIYMKNRDFDPMVKIIREAREKNENLTLAKIDKFNAVGMKGLEWIDWVCVAPGWLAKYRSELVNVAKEEEAKYQDLLKKYQRAEYADVLPTQESKVNRALSEIMSDEAQDYEAVARADDAVRRMQPSSRITDISPLYKGKNEVAQILLQFQTALNVIWQNLRYDLPLAVKEKQAGTIVGMVTGYVLAGVCMGMLTAGFDDDDDDEKKKAAKIVYYSTTQFTEAFPVIGDLIGRYAIEPLLTGKRAYSGQQSVLPAVEKALVGMGDAIATIREEDPNKRAKRYIKAAGNMAEAAGLYFGLPTSGAKELGRAAGIGDGDGEFELYLQALTGRKNKH
jgi:hypothetical protein